MGFHDRAEPLNTFDFAIESDVSDANNASIPPRYRAGTVPGFLSFPSSLRLWMWRRCPLFVPFEKLGDCPRVSCRAAPNYLMAVPLKLSFGILFSTGFLSLTGGLEPHKPIPITGVPNR
jgi:hypothetical protein